MAREHNCSDIVREFFSREEFSYDESWSGQRLAQFYSTIYSRSQWLLIRHEECANELVIADPKTIPYQGEWYFVPESEFPKKEDLVTLLGLQNAKVHRVITQKSFEYKQGFVGDTQVRVIKTRSKVSKLEVLTNQLERHYLVHSLPQSIHLPISAENSQQLNSHTSSHADQGIVKESHEQMAQLIVKQNQELLLYRQETLLLREALKLQSNEINQARQSQVEVEQKHREIRKRIRKQNRYVAKVEQKCQEKISRIHEIAKTKARLNKKLRMCIIYQVKSIQSSVAAMQKNHSYQREVSSRIHEDKQFKGDQVQELAAILLENNSKETEMIEEINVQMIQDGQKLIANEDDTDIINREEMEIASDLREQAEDKHEIQKEIINGNIITDESHEITQQLPVENQPISDTRGSTVDAIIQEEVRDSNIPAQMEFQEDCKNRSQDIKNIEPTIIEAHSLTPTNTIHEQTGVSSLHQRRDDHMEQPDDPFESQNCSLEAEITSILVPENEDDQVSSAGLSNSTFQQPPIVVNNHEEEDIIIQVHSALADVEQVVVLGDQSTINNIQTVDEPTILEFSEKRDLPDSFLEPDNNRPEESYGIQLNSTPNKDELSKTEQQQQQQQQSITQSNERTDQSSHSLHDDSQTDFIVESSQSPPINAQEVENELNSPAIRAPITPIPPHSMNPLDSHISDILQKYLIPK